MNTVGRMHLNTPQELIEEFLRKGGKITICPPGERTEDIEYISGFYGKRKAKKVEDVEIEVEPTDDEES